MEKVGIFYGHLEYITGIWYTLWLYGTLVAISPRFGKMCQEKSGNPGFQHGLCQDCQMVYFKTKNRNLGKFWRALDWKMLLH
jgi:hypothetical protein